MHTFAPIGTFAAIGTTEWILIFCGIAILYLTGLLVSV